MLVGLVRQPGPQGKRFPPGIGAHLDGEQVEVGMARGAHGRGRPLAQLLARVAKLRQHDGPARAEAGLREAAGDLGRGLAVGG